MNDCITIAVDVWNRQIRTTVVVTKLGEEIKSLKLRLVDYQSKAGNEDLLRQMLEKKNKELANLQVQLINHT